MWIGVITHSTAAMCFSLTKSHFRTITIGLIRLKCINKLFQRRKAWTFLQSHASLRSPMLCCFRVACVAIYDAYSYHTSLRSLWVVDTGFRPAAVRRLCRPVVF